MSPRTCKRCGAEMTKQISIPCPEGRVGCAVAHYRLVCACEDIPLELLEGSDEP